jgi:hypothetical protein
VKSASIWNIPGLDTHFEVISGNSVVERRSAEAGLRSGKECVGGIYYSPGNPTFSGRMYLGSMNPLGDASTNKNSRSRSLQGHKRVGVSRLEPERDKVVNCDQFSAV